MKVPVLNTHAVYFVNTCHASSTPPPKPYFMEVPVYLDAAGAAIPDKELMRSICEDMMSISFGNPHSVGNTASDDTANRISEARDLVRKHFNVHSDEYDVVFTSGATSSMNLVGQSFPWKNESQMCYPMNSHTSLLGLRDYAPNVYCVPSISLQSTVDIDKGLYTEPVLDNTGDYNLLLVPGECNFSGAKGDLAYVAQLSQLRGDKLLKQLNATPVKEASHGDMVDRIENNNSWLWLLDAAKLASTSEIDLSLLPQEQRPHFITISFYKIFGYPTGLGALLIRRDAAHILQKKYFGGGTLQAAAANSLFCRPKTAHPHEYLEDGTPNYYAIAALRHGFSYFNRLGGMQFIERHTYELTHSLVIAMAQLVHNRTVDTDSMHVPLCTVYGKHFEPTVSSKTQGPVITFSLRWADGTPIGFSEVGRLAAERNIHLRTGCFCNVGGCQEALGQSAADVEYNYSIGRVCSEAGHDVVNGRHTGAVRVSLGYHSTPADCSAFLRFLTEEFLNRAPEPMPAFAAMGANDEDSGTRNWLPPLDPDNLFLTPSPQRSTIDINDDKIHGNVAHSGDAEVPRPIKLAAIFVYPIKSCAGIRVDSWPLCNSGLLYDRDWALVDAQGRAITQKVFAKLALVQPSINLRDGVMLVRAPGMAEVLAISLLEKSELAPCLDSTSSGGSMKGDTVSVCGQVRQGRRISFDADQWFTRYLSNPNPSTSLNSTASATVTTTVARSSAQRKEISCTLLRCAVEPAPSDKMEKKSVDSGETARDISFANTAQFLLLSLESVHALTQMILASNDAGRGSLNIKVENFRPNLLVSGGSGAPHQEDTWTTITLLGQKHPANEDVGTTVSSTLASVVPLPLPLQITGPCSRCSMVNVDGSSGSMDCRAFQALSTYRKDGSSVYFGQFCALPAELEKAQDSDINVGIEKMQENNVWVTVGSIVDVV